MTQLSSALACCTWQICVHIHTALLPHIFGVVELRHMCAIWPMPPCQLRQARESILRAFKFSAETHMHARPGVKTALPVEAVSGLTWPWLSWRAARRRRGWPAPEDPRGVASPPASKSAARRAVARLKQRGGGRQHQARLLSAGRRRPRGGRRRGPARGGRGGAGRPGGGRGRGDAAA